MRWNATTHITHKQKLKPNADIKCIRKVVCYNLDENAYRLCTALLIVDP